MHPRGARRAFTLIELLAVMGIIILMASAVAASYFGMARGAGMRAAVNQIRSTLLLARQKAIMDGMPVYLFFEQDGSTNSYLLCQMDGTATTGGGGTTMVDRWNPNIADLAESSVIWNLDEEVYGRIAEVDQDAYAIVTDGTDPYGTIPVAWNDGDRYGFELQSRQFLPPGIRFGSGGTDVLPETIIFYKDGTAQKKTGSSSMPYETIRVYEELSGNTFMIRLYKSGYVTTENI